MTSKLLVGKRRSRLLAGKSAFRGSGLRPQSTPNIWIGLRQGYNPKTQQTFKPGGLSVKRPNRFGLRTRRSISR